jgi:hypothetical protein
MLGLTGSGHVPSDENRHAGAQETPIRAAGLQYPSEFDSVRERPPWKTPPHLEDSTDAIPSVESESGAGSFATDGSRSDAMESRERGLRSSDGWRKIGGAGIEGRENDAKSRTAARRWAPRSSSAVPYPGFAGHFIPDEGTLAFAEDTRKQSRPDAGEKITSRAGISRMTEIGTPARESFARADPRPTPFGIRIVRERSYSAALRRQKSCL